MKLSIIVVSYNVKGYLSLCISSALKAMSALEKGASELIVVDNASYDDSVDWVSSNYPEVHLIPLSENLGFSKANNRGIARAKGEWILLLNPDTIVPEQTFVKILSHVDEDERVGGLGVPMYDGAGQWLPESKRGLPTPWASFCRLSGLWRLSPGSRRLNSYYFGHVHRGDTADVEVLSGAFMWMRRTALEQVGLLDESFFMYGEDIDLSVRLLRGGWVNRYYSETPIVHFKGESTKKGSLSYVRVFHDAMRIFCAKHFDGSQAWAMRWMIRIGIRFRSVSAFLHGLVSRHALNVTDVLLGATCAWGVLRLHGLFYGFVHPTLPSLALIGVAGCSVVLAGRWFGSGDLPFQRLRALLAGIGASVSVVLLYSLMPESLRVSRLSAIVVALLLVFFPLVVRAVLVGVNRRRYRWRPARPRIGIAAHEERGAQLRRWVEESYGSALDVDLLDADALDFEKAQKFDMVLHGAELGGNACLHAVRQGGAWGVDVRLVPFDMSLALGGLRRDGAPAADLSLGGDGLARADRRRTKRRLDIFWSLLVLLVGPGKGRTGAAFSRRQAWRVLRGKRTWLGFHKGWEGDHRLPALQEGVLLVGSGVRASSEEEARRLDLRHASDFGWLRDLELLMNLRWD